MNRKKIIAIIFTIVLVLFLGYYFYSSIKLVPPIFIPGSVVTEQGIVLTNTVDEFLVGDGPYFFIVRKETGIRSGSEIKVLYHPQSDDRTCLNAFIDGLQVKAGEKIEVHAIAINEDTLSICPSKDYYVKVISSVDSQQQGAKISTQQECKSSRGQWRGDVCVAPASEHNI